MNLKMIITFSIYFFNYDYKFRNYKLNIGIRNKIIKMDFNIKLQAYYNIYIVTILKRYIPIYVIYNIIITIWYILSIKNYTSTTKMQIQYLLYNMYSLSMSLYLMDLSKFHVNNENLLEINVKS